MLQTCTEHPSYKLRKLSGKLAIRCLKQGELQRHAFQWC